MALDRRVARFQALADPVRLRIVDLLALGDLAPVELQHAVGVASNLLAHHLGVLERNGLVERARSEFDRRRSYLRLADDAVLAVVLAPSLDASRIVFVCTGNSARSQLAAALWHRRSRVPVASAGTRPAAAIEPAAVDAARRHRLTLRARVPRALDEVARPGDLVVTVCDGAHEVLAGRDRLHWSVPDPVRDGSDAAFDRAIEDLADRIGVLAPHLEPVG